VTAVPGHVEEPVVAVVLGLEVSKSSFAGAACRITSGRLPPLNNVALGPLGRSLEQAVMEAAIITASRGAVNALMEGGIGALLL
jgi:hypothetical protein